MRVKRGLIVILVSVLALPVAEGCQPYGPKPVSGSARTGSARAGRTARMGQKGPYGEERSQVLEIPPPLPRYLSREHEDAKPAESEAPAESARQERADSPDQPARTPEEVAAQIRDLEKVLARRTKEEAGRNLRDVRIAVEVPMTAEEPIRRIDDGPPKRTPPTETGNIALTAIKPVGAEEKAEDVTGPVTLATLTKRYETMARSAPGDVEVGRTLRFLYFLSGEDEKSLEAMGGLSGSQQKLWRDLMWTLIVARDRMPGVSRADHAAEVLDALAEVRNGLRKEAPLELGEVRFCEEILRFGVYTPLAINRFRPGQQALLYSEVSNFVSTKESDGLCHVRLSERLSLANSSGTEVWRHVFENIHDACRSLRDDFFLGTTIPLPGDLKPGKYVLKVAIEDITTSKSVGARLELEIIAASGGR